MLLQHADLDWRHDFQCCGVDISLGDRFYTCAQECDYDLCIQCFHSPLAQARPCAMLQIAGSSKSIAHMDAANDAD